MKEHARDRDTVPKRRDSPRSLPSQSEGTPPADDGEETGRVSHDEFFGTPALEEDSDEELSLDFLDSPDSDESDPADVWSDPEADPPTVPPLSFTAYPPQRALYEEAFRAAFKYPDALMLVMDGIRKGLKRGKEAAERRGDSR